MGALKERCGLDQSRLRHEDLIGTREHIGTAISYLPIYNTHFYISCFRSRDLYCNMIFCVPRVPIVGNKGFFGTDTACGFFFKEPAGRLFCAVTAGLNFSVVSEGDATRLIPRKEPREYDR